MLSASAPARPDIRKPPLKVQDFYSRQRPNSTFLKRHLSPKTPQKAAESLETQPKSTKTSQTISRRYLDKALFGRCRFSNQGLGCIPYRSRSASAPGRATLRPPSTPSGRSYLLWWRIGGRNLSTPAPEIAERSALFVERARRAVRSLGVEVYRFRVPRGA